MWQQMINKKQIGVTKHKFMADFLRTNNVKIVGHLISADMKTGARKDTGAGYISGNAVVQSVIGGEKKEFEISFYANEQTQDKKVSKLYTSYSKMNELVGKKVEITGELRENRYYSNNAKQLVSAQQISGRFVRGVSEATDDVATFELGGFVVSELTERKNKKGEIFSYSLQLGQANYSGNAMSIFTVSARPSDVDIIKGLQSMYRAGDTVVVNGVLDWVVEVVTKESDNVGFGSGAVHSYTNRMRNFWISGGSKVVEKEEDGKYTQGLIRDLLSAYKNKDVELMNSAKTNSDGDKDFEEKPPVTNRQTSLI